MKKLIGIIVALAGFSAFAGLDTTGLNYVEIQAPTAYTNGTISFPTNGVDISSYKGNAKFIVYDSGNTTVNSQTNAVVVIQHAVAATGTWTTATTGSFTALATTGTVQSVSVDLGALHKFVRVSVTLQGTNSLNHYIGGSLVAP